MKSKTKNEKEIAQSRRLCAAVHSQTLRSGKLVGMSGPPGPPFPTWCNSVGASSLDIKHTIDFSVPKELSVEKVQHAFAADKQFEV
ncbi:hypothetical protein EI546_03565 [Aequorivita sp. H23M31]|uniref:Uncharacterized protein n=1 Tax=Aequorivita ciconiae TaxID=2494375 RepID=A0A410G0Q9_9FLAO|nr:hypothetical protein [Aequorivita sp. H23M31]QAA80862.1 hypothetical protein EI546_03565 [Aequorivita sp. H23M31]